MLKIYTPKYEDLFFRQKLLSDPKTMSYNEKWGGTIDFPKEAWQDWYDFWLVDHENKRFYRYLQETETGSFVGDIDYHYDEKLDMYLAGVVVLAEYRGNGYGKEGLGLLCDAAKINGVKVLYDNIAVDNSAISMFLKEGFLEEYRTEDYIFLKKALSD